MTGKHPTLLIVDDNEDDLTIMRMAFRKAALTNRVVEVGGGEEAIAYLMGEGYRDRREYPLPSVILLDLNMPRKSGFDVLEWVRQQPVLKRVSIIILTASTRAEDVQRAFDLGANSFLVKPGNIAALSAMLRCMGEWLQYNHFPPLDGSSGK